MEPVWCRAAKLTPADAIGYPHSVQGNQLCARAAAHNLIVSCWTPPLGRLAKVRDSPCKDDVKDAACPPTMVDSGPVAGKGAMVGCASSLPPILKSKGRRANPSSVGIQCSGWGNWARLAGLMEGRNGYSHSSTYRATILLRSERVVGCMQTHHSYPVRGKVGCIKCLQRVTNSATSDQHASGMLDGSEPFQWVAHSKAAAPAAIARMS